MSVAAGNSLGAETSFEQMPGVIAPSDPAGRPGFLSDVIAEMGLVDPDTIESAVNESRVQGRASETILLERGKLTEQELARAIAERNGLPFVDLESFPEDEEARTLIDGDVARRYRALPIAIEGRAVVVALADPLDALAIDEIAGLTRREVIPAIAAASMIDSLVEQLPKGAPTPAAEPKDGPVRLESVDGQASRVVTTADSLPGGLQRRIVDVVETALEDVAHSEILKALDEATSEIEKLSGTLEAAEQRALALEAERDELRAAVDARPES
jgi:hypothetical protein